MRPSHVVAAIRHRPSKVPHLNENGRTASCITELHCTHLLFQEIWSVHQSTCGVVVVHTAHSRDLRESEVLGHGAVLLLPIRAIFCPPTIGGSPKIWTAKTFCPPNANKWRNPPFGFQILKHRKNCESALWAYLKSAFIKRKALINKL